MIVDSSALIAVLAAEPLRPRLLDAMLAAERLLMSAATYLETAAVIDRRGDPVLSRRLDELLEALGLEIVEVSPDQARLGREAYRDFGKGSGHPAGLNYGDCFTYALARDSGLPLLHTGDDFNHTDVRTETVQ
ncbi:type II toxin-antitoxin system VapC family toxin [Nocardioides limicola]|uniref:type II toxin-antitoxin system VapC family toxin n=1 Tax=Nocardioides limicola TaxID=2803368 RepID=UPI00193AE8CD|nr:type II toxin-antitoxin system VapC family toxin [Nocardioides sp. DJM-14]